MNNTIQKPLTVKNAFWKALSVAYQNNLGFAAWQLPHTNNQHFIIGKVASFDMLDDLSGEGFVFHPYDDSHPGYCIHSEVRLTVRQQQTTCISSDSTLEQAIYQSTSDNKYHITDIIKHPSTTRVEYINYVNNSIDAINAGHFQKIVPARRKNIELSDNFDLFDNFYRLCEAYPNSFVSVVSIPQVGTWLGATPEMLINVENGSQFSTVALAGTQNYRSDMHLTQIAWTQKEIEEQAMVSRYIINCFKKIRLREFEEIGPKSIVAGNLIHLKTTFHVDMKATAFPQLGSVMLDLLHPTSAVCGMPKQPAADFISKNEKPRRHFSGYLGPVSPSFSTQLFVNLRCMELFKDYATLYAGAGVTEDSIPEKEWLETEMKMSTLLNIIEN